MAVKKGVRFRRHVDSLYRRPRGRRLAPVISRLTGEVAAEPSPEERWFRDHWQAAYQVLEYVDVTGKSVADAGSGDGILLALTLGGRPRELVGYDVTRRRSITCSTWRTATAACRHCRQELSLPGPGEDRRPDTAYASS